MLLAVCSHKHTLIDPLQALHALKRFGVEAKLTLLHGPIRGLAVQTGMAAAAAALAQDLLLC